MSTFACHHSLRQWLRYRARICPFLFLSASSCMLACGGATTSGPADNVGDAGDKNDAADKDDAAAPNDGGNKNDAGDGGRPECDSSVVTCRVLPPPCPAGEVPVVSGSCWAGYCVKPSACRTVRDCSVCSAD